MVTNSSQNVSIDPYDSHPSLTIKPPRVFDNQSVAKQNQSRRSSRSQSVRNKNTTPIDSRQLPGTRKSSDRQSLQGEEIQQNEASNNKIIKKKSKYIMQEKSTDEEMRVESNDESTKVQRKVTMMMKNDVRVKKDKSFEEQLEYELSKNKHNINITKNDYSSATFKGNQIFQVGCNKPEPIKENKYKRSSSSSDSSDYVLTKKSSNNTDYKKLYKKLYYQFQYLNNKLIEQEKEYQENLEKQERQFQIKFKEQERQFQIKFDEQEEKFKEQERQYQAKLQEQEKQFQLKFKEQEKRFWESIDPERHYQAKLDEQKRQFQNKLNELERKYMKKFEEQEANRLFKLLEKKFANDSFQMLQSDDQENIEFERSSSPFFLVDKQDSPSKEVCLDSPILLCSILKTTNSTTKTIKTPLNVSWAVNLNNFY